MYVTVSGMSAADLSQHPNRATLEVVNDYYEAAATRML